MKPAYRNIFCILFVLYSVTVYAQEKKELWIAPMSDYLTLKFTQSQAKEKLGAYMTGSDDIRISPNSSSVSHLGFSYRFISFSFKFTAPFLPGNNDEDLKGKTNSKGFSFGLNFSHWLQEFSYSKSTGYYVENTGELDPNWKPGDPYIQLPDLTYKNIEGITRYSFNPKFSANAVSSSSERQLKSAGSFIPQVLYRYYTIANKIELVPGGSKQSSKNFEVAIGAGYYYNYVVKQKFYFSLGITPSIGYQGLWLTTSFYDTSLHSKQDNLLLRISGRAGIGYNNERFFAGIYSRLLAEKYKQGNNQASIQDESLMVEIFLGYRLRAPKWLKKNVQGTLDKLQTTFLKTKPVN